jgi:predicted Zn-dependent protease
MICSLCETKIVGEYIVKDVDNEEKIYCHQCYTKLKIQLPVKIRRD